MPLYEYRCPSCDRRFELLRELGDHSADATCPACGSARSVRQLSTFAVSHSTTSTAGAEASDSYGCGRPQCGGGSCAGGDWN